MAIDLSYRRLFLAAALSLAICVALTASNPVHAAGAMAVTDLSGVSRSIPAGAHKATVLFFIQHDCPISLSYAPEMNRLCRAYGAKGIAFDIVYAEPGLSAASARGCAQAYAYACPAILDLKLKLARRVGATAVPEAVVLSDSGDVLYRGRIDNLYAAYGLRRPQATTHDLADALDAVLAGKPVKHPTTPMVGCFISSVGVE